MGTKFSYIFLLKRTCLWSVF